MTSKLTTPLRREIDIDGETYTVVIGPDGLRLTRKRFRQGLAMSWRALRDLDPSEEQAGPSREKS